mgnify:CR=1 FL=1
MTGAQLVPGALLTALFEESRQRLLLFVAERGAVQHEALEREWLDVSGRGLERVCQDLISGGWLTAAVGADGATRLQLVPGVADEAGEDLLRLLPGCWAADELDFDALAGELNLLRSPAQLAVLAALRQGHSVAPAVAQSAGVSVATARAQLIALRGRGLLVGGPGAWAFASRPLQLWALLVRLGARAPLPLRPSTERLAAAVAIVVEAAESRLAASGLLSPEGWAAAAPDTRRDALLVWAALGQIAGLIQQAPAGLPTELYDALRRSLDISSESLQELILQGTRAGEALHAMRQADATLGGWLEQRGQA